MNVNMTVPLEVSSAVRDLPRMRCFYEEVLGCRFVCEVVVPPEKARESALGTTGYPVARLPTSYGERIKLLAPVDWRPAAAPPEYILDQANAFYLTFIVDDIDAVVARLRDEGVSFMTGARRVEVRPSTYVAFCRDPEGNVLEIVQYADVADYRPDLHERSA